MEYVKCVAASSLIRPFQQLRAIEGTWIWLTMQQPGQVRPEGIEGDSRCDELWQRQVAAVGAQRG